MSMSFNWKKTPTPTTLQFRCDSLIPPTVFNQVCSFDPNSLLFLIHLLPLEYCFKKLQQQHGLVLPAGGGQLLCNSPRLAQPSGAAFTHTDNWTVCAAIMTIWCRSRIERPRRILVQVVTGVKTEDQELFFLMLSTLF